MDAVEAIRTALVGVNRPKVIDILAEQFPEELIAALTEKKGSKIYDAIGYPLAAKSVAFFNARAKENEKVALKQAWTVTTVSLQYHGESWQKYFSFTDGSYSARKIFLGRLTHHDGTINKAQVAYLRWQLEYSFTLKADGKPVNTQGEFWRDVVQNTYNYNSDFGKIMTERYWSKGETGPTTRKEVEPIVREGYKLKKKRQERMLAEIDAYNEKHDKN